MYIISKNWHFMCLVKPLKEAFQKFCECMKLKVFNVHLMKHWGAIIMSWSWTQSQWTRECTQFSLGLNYHKKIIIYTLSLMHKGGKKIGIKVQSGHFRSMPQSYFNIMVMDTKRKAPMLGKYMFYHVSIYDNGIEVFTFFQYKNDIGIKF
jgi:hypothetical protein